MTKNIHKSCPCCMGYIGFGHESCCEYPVNVLIEACRSWHEFHHGSSTVQCDAICEALKELDLVKSRELGIEGNGVL